MRRGPLLVLLTVIAATIAIPASVAVGARTPVDKVADEKSTGKLYDDPKIYANCDIRSLSATKQKKKLVATVGLRGKQKQFVNTSLYLNTKGGKQSAPELLVDGSGSITATTGVDQAGNFRNQKVRKATAKVSTKAGGKQVVFKVPVGQLGGVAKVGVQAKTCGEGAVDTAPGKDYFDDTSFTGKVAFRYLTVKLR